LNLDYISSLDLSNNKVSEIKRDLFSEIQDIKDLNLSGNLITKLDKSVFTNLNNLRKLDLSNNQLTKNDTFGSIKELMELYLNGNKTKSMKLKASHLMA
jgi:Leucine-rich repeat (LRR) protein